VGELLKKELGVETELIVGDRSEFTIRVNDKVVFKKESLSAFPEDQKILEAVREALKSQGE
jgi:predicted Rdx family selenoprotein